MAERTNQFEVYSRTISGSWHLRARAGYSLDKSPAYRRALTDEQRGVQYLAQGRFDMQPGPGFEPVTFWSLVNLLYPLSYSRPLSFWNAPVYYFFYDPSTIFILSWPTFFLCYLILYDILLACYYRYDSMHI